MKKSKKGQNRALASKGKTAAERKLYVKLAAMKRHAFDKLIALEEAGKKGGTAYRRAAEKLRKIGLMRDQAEKQSEIDFDIRHHIRPSTRKKSRSLYKRPNTPYFVQARREQKFTKHRRSR